jgi:hypothetical protein
LIVLDRIWPPKAVPNNWLTHLGGWPNLPEDFPWPNIRFADGSGASLDFLAQVNLADLPQSPEESLLPQSGVLYFFALSQTPLPLEEYGSAAFRVIYHTGSASAFQPRKPPEDAGWGQDDLAYARTCAVNMRNTDAPRSELFPYCPVKPRLITLQDRASLSESPRQTNKFKYQADELPRRVGDAVLSIDHARNSFLENIAPLEAYLAYEPPLPACIPQFKKDYYAWQLRAAAASNSLSALGCSTLLAPEQRSMVLQICEEASALHQQLGRPRLIIYPQEVAKTALATLLLRDPKLAEEYPDEVAAAHPSKAPFGHPHHMLGTAHDVQGGTMERQLPGGTEEEQVVLLQLESDPWGPRFMWWDAGNLTFWMTVRDMAALRFDCVKAEIEGH